MEDILNQKRMSFFDPLELLEQKKGLMPFKTSKKEEQYLSPFYAERGIAPGQNIVTDTPVSEFNYTGKDKEGNEGKSYSTHLVPFSKGSEIYPAYKKDAAGFPQNLLRLYYEESQSNNLFNFSGKFCLFNMGDDYYNGIIKKFPEIVESFYQKGEKKLDVRSLEQQAEYMKLIADSKSNENTLTEVEIYRALKLAVWHKSPQGSFEEIVGSINDLLADGVLWVAKGLDTIKISEKRYLADNSAYEPFLGGSEPMKFVLNGGLSTLQNMISSGIMLLKIGGRYFLPKGFENIIKSLDILTTHINESISRLKKKLPETLDHKWKLGNAFFCGLINGLISLLEFILQAVAFLLGIDGIIKNYEDYAESRYYSEITEEVLNILFIEMPLLLNGFTALLLDVKNLDMNDIESLLRLVKEKTGNVSQYQMAYYAGGIVFEVIVGVLLAVFTGGAGNIAKAASTSEKFAQYIKIIGREFVSSVSFGISDILAVFRGLIRSFVKACENGFEGFIKWVENIFSGLKNGKKVDNLIEEATDLEELIITVERKNPKGKINRQQEILNAKTIDKKPLPTYDEGFEYYEAKTPGDFDIPIVLRRQSKLLMHKVDREVQNLLNPNITSGFSKGKKVFLNKNGLKSVKEGWLIDRVLVAGMIHRDKKLGEIIVTKINYPKSEMNKLLRKNDRERGKVSLSDVKELYNHFKKTGYLDYGMHPYIENLLKNHFDEIAKGIKYPSSYNWELTGGLPGTHAEVLALNDLLWKLESKKVTLTEEVLKGFLGYNKNIKKQQYMIRCGDCQLILKDVLFLEKVTKFK